MKNYGLHWFRRDLRISGNPALNENLRRHAGRVLGIFFFDSQFLARPDFSHNRFGFFLNTLKALKAEMQACGGDLLVLDAPPLQGFPRVFEQLQQSGPLPQICSYNRDYEPFARNRDSTVERLLGEDFGIEALSCADHLLIEPGDLHKPNGGTYQVFTPFSKAWLKLLDQYEERLDQAYSFPVKFTLNWAQILGQAMHEKHNGLKDQLKFFCSENQKKLTVLLPPAGHTEALHCLEQFQVSNYATARDFPASNGTSRLAIYLKNGSITTAQILASLRKKLGSEYRGHAYIRQLIWREFYFHILFHHPEVESRTFLTQYRAIPWQNSEAWFESWKKGQTGFPIVDAGMRQLLQTGGMHNRVRMIVASFLTKDLLIDWRWGERWFMQHLLDGDLAANNGGWQWAASTGCDPQPYFRVFNPELQSRKFDPQGSYIRRYVPELSELSDQAIHAPGERRPHNYPAPIVDHAKQKVRAVALFKSEKPRPDDPGFH